MNRRTKRRMWALTVIAALWVGAIAWRLWSLQVSQHQVYLQRAAQQQNRIVTLTPPRGTIFDRNGRELAVSLEVASVAADPDRVEDIGATLEELSKILDFDSAKLRRLREGFASEKTFVWVARKVDPPQADAIRALKLPGIFLLPENKRYYPLRHLASHVLGYVGTDNKGLSGLEYLYNEVVSSEPGRRRVVRDARYGTVLFPHLEVTAAQPGHDLRLTLDVRLQYLAEEALGDAMEEHNAKRGMVVMMDVETGAILAMASAPDFDPNRFQEFPSDTWRNPVVTDAYEPGSTFKMVTLAAALEAHAVTPQDVFFCENGGIRMYGKRISDHSSFGNLTVRQILAKSSNVGAIKLGQKAGRPQFFKTIEAFGFGRPTGIDLPSESAGILRPLERWQPLTAAYVSFGQGVSTTALQLVTAFAAIANDGWLVEPHIVASYGRPGEEPTIRRASRTPLQISPSTVRQVRSILESVVVEGGTATTAAMPGYRAAGKTGTAQKAAPGGGYMASRYVASFVGFAPLERPKVVAAVIIDEPHPRYHGGEVAAPVFRRMVGPALLHLGITPDDPADLWPGEIEDERTPQVTLASIEPEQRLVQESEAQESEAQEPEDWRDLDANGVPSFSGLTAREALMRATTLGLRLKIHGHGRVTHQKPDAGHPVILAADLPPESPTIELWLSRNPRARGASS